MNLKNNMKKDTLYKGKLFEINAYHLEIKHRKIRS